MEFRVLGPLEVVDASGRTLTFAGVKERTILAALLVARGDVVSTDRLVDILWSEQPPANPANALQARISALRRTLGSPHVIVTRSPGYRLAIEAADVDAIRFETLVDQARAAAGRSAIDLYDRALALLRGAPYVEFAYEDFAQAETVRLQELLLSAREERIQALLDAGRHGEVLGELEALVSDHPLRERGWGQLMVALYRSGRQADALRAFRQAASILGEELGIEPSPELCRLEEAILVQDPALDPPGLTTAPLHNLPARLNSLVGRADDISRVVDLIGTHRLVTLTGPGGVGKTSLAVAIGERALPQFQDGVWFVELAGVADPYLVPAAIAGQVGADVGDRSTLDLVGEVLRDRRTLLILDNCEHLVDAVAEATFEILQKAPAAKIVATSREPLGVTGEILWPTRPLPAPTQALASSAIESYASVLLFVERARAALPDFAMDQDAAPAVADICRRLDGLPLAIELAAARVRNLPVTEISARLDDRFRLLVRGARTVVPRQQTLEATIDWSYALLSPDESRLFRRLSVFVGGWSLEAAEAVAGDTTNTFELLDRLVDRSLVVAESSGPVLRYSMLETIRAFAARQLVTSGENEETVLRHAEWFLALAESEEPRSPRQADWVRKLTAEQENLRAAIAQCLAVGATDMALRLGGRLGWWWFFGNRDEGRSILDQLLDATAAEATRGRIASLHARVRLNLFGPTLRSTELAEEALEVALALGDETAVAYSKVYVALGGAHRQEGARALGLLDEAAACFSALGDDWGQGLASFQRMEVVAHTGHLREAIAEGERALSSFRHTGDPWAVSAALAHLARYRRLIGDEAAAEVASEALEVAAARDLPHTVQYVMTTQAYLRLRAGDHAGARRLFQEALEISKEVGNEVGLATNWDGVAEARLAAGEIEEALECHRLALEEHRRLGLAGGLAYSLARLGLAEESAGRWAGAAVHHREALEVASRAGDVTGMIPALEGLGREAARRRDPERAARLLATGAALRDRTGLAIGPVEAGATEAARETTTGQLDSNVFTAITAQVASMDTTALVSLVR